MLAREVVGEQQQDVLGKDHGITIGALSHPQVGVLVRRFVLATSTQQSIRPEDPDAPLRWLSLPDAAEATAEANLRSAQEPLADRWIHPGKADKPTSSHREVGTNVPIGERLS